MILFLKSRVICSNGMDHRCLDGPPCPAAGLEGGTFQSQAWRGMAGMPALSALFPNLYVLVPV